MRQSDIRIDIDYAVEPHLDRVVELVNRSNQLNYTKVRIETGSDKQNFLADLKAFGFNAGVVRLRDRYADYGIVGFFMTLATLREYRLIHFVFSCRIMNMGVEQYVYDYLNRPDVTVSGPVANPIVAHPAVDWIRVAPRGEAFIGLKESKLVLIGGCDMLQLSTYCSMESTEFTNRDVRGLMKRLDDPFLILDDPGLVRRSEVRPLIPAFDAEDMVELRSAVLDADAVVVSFGRMTEVNYFRGGDGLTVRLDQDAVKAILGSEQALWFVRNFSFVEFSYEQRLDLVGRCLGRLAGLVKAGAVVIVLSENVRKLENNPGERDLRAAYNGFIRRKCEEFKNLTYLDVNAVINIDWIWDDAFHMHRMGYHELAQHVRRIIGSARAGVPAGEGRLVYYSISTGGGHCEGQFARSIASLRRHNPTVPVHVCVYNEPTPVLIEAARRHGASVHSMGGWQAYLEPLTRHAGTLALLPCLHKFLSLQHLPLADDGQVLYLDCDTHFFGDVGSLFEAYRDCDFYAREEPATALSGGADPLHVDEAALQGLFLREGLRPVVPFNAGVVLFNRGVWREVNRNRLRFLEYCWRLVLSGCRKPMRFEPDRRLKLEVLDAVARGDAGEDLPYPSGSLWIVDEVALWLTLGAVGGLRQGFFRRTDVLQNGEYQHTPPGVLAHYFSGNADGFYAWLDTPPAATANPAGESARRVDDDWRRWIGENLLLDVPRDQILGALIEAGFSRDEATVEIVKAIESPYAQGAEALRSRLRQSDWLLSALRGLDRLRPGSGVVARHRKPPRGVFLGAYYYTNRPLVITHAFGHWPALSRWVPAELAARYGDRLVEVRSAPGAAGAGLSEMWGDVGPVHDYLDAETLATGMIGFSAPGDSTPSRCNPENRLIAQVVGRRRLLLTPSLDLSLDEDPTRGASAPDAQVMTAPAPPDEARRVLECVVAPGELLFLPVGWTFSFETLDTSASVTFSLDHDQAFPRRDCDRGGV